MKSSIELIDGRMATLRSTATTGIRSGGAIADSFFAVKTVYTSSGSPVRTFTNNGIVLKDTVVPSQLTFCVWLKTSLSSRWQVILSNASYYATAANTFPFQLWLSSLGGIYVALDQGGDYSADFAYVVSGLSLTDNNWHHLGCIYRANNDVRIYVDGDLKNTQSHTVTCNSPGLAWCIGTFAIYNSQSEADHAFNGDMAYPVFAPNLNDASIITNAFLIKPF